MNSKLNISRWVFLALAAVTVIIAVLYYLVVGTIEPAFKAGEPTPRADLFLNWGYILIILGIVLALVSVVFTALVKGVNVKTLLIAVIAFAVIAVVAYLMSSSAFSQTYQAGEITYSGKTHGLVTFGLNFFYVTLAVAIISILFSVIYKAVKK
jgi:ABC-type branched-subunit amino acid transport system permease subunit